MKRCVLLLCCLVFCLFCLRAHADVPSILMDDPTCSEGSTSYNGGTLPFTANTTGGGFFKFCNNTTQKLTTVDVKFANASQLFGFIACDSTSGFTCAQSINEVTGVIDLLFTPNVEGAGYQIGNQLSFNLNTPLCTECLPPVDPNGAGGWFDNNGNPVTFFWAGNESAVIAPEPSTFALLGCGLAGAWRMRRRRK